MIKVIKIWILALAISIIAFAILPKITDPETKAIGIGFELLLFAIQTYVMFYEKN